ncbi:MAG: hypothetical protein COS92_02925 [Desulfobacterales bacterium CG07_land_8_20_14_0_80_52_14]|nr:MAG: hypothetical protein COS92_02925 [Desulfobacterales bacterium CG07_land_8_20_14_0_80_52_14]
MRNPLLVKPRSVHSENGPAFPVLQSVLGTASSKSSLLPGGKSGNHKESSPLPSVGEGEGEGERLLPEFQIQLLHRRHQPGRQRYRRGCDIRRL